MTAKRFLKWCTIAFALYLFGSIAAVRYNMSTLRAQIPNGTYLNKAHPFSDRIVLREPEGSVVVWDVGYVLFNEGYVAGVRDAGDGATQRFIYRLADRTAVLDAPETRAEFRRMLAESGLGEAVWPVYREDPRWLDYERMTGYGMWYDGRYRSYWYDRQK